MKLDTKIFEEKMLKSIDSYKYELDAVRAGRANPNILSRISVDYYGTPTPVNQIGNVSCPDARTIVIQPWDSSTLKAVEKAILASDIGITPANDGKVIRLVFPQLTEDRRKELKKQVSKMGEDSKVALRNHRREAMDVIKKAKTAKEISEDEASGCEADVEKTISGFMTKVEAVIAAKEKELMSV